MPAQSTNLSKQQLASAAAMRADGTSWNQIRDAHGVKWSSTKWFKEWQANGIDHIPAHERAVKAATAKAAQPKAKTTTGTQRKGHTRSGDSKRHPVTTTNAATVSIQQAGNDLADALVGLAEYVASLEESDATPTRRQRLRDRVTSAKERVNVMRPFGSRTRPTA